MTQEKKLTTILERGRENGWDSDYCVWMLDMLYRGIKIKDMNWERVLFSHPFTQAYFGEKWKDDEQACNEDCYTHETTSRWEHHLPQVVLSKDPINYIFKNFEQKKEVEK